MKRCDTNKDGVVEFSEVQAKFNEEWIDEEIAEEKARFDSMDTNKDGKVNKEEFRKWIYDMMVKGSSQWRGFSSLSQSALANDPKCVSYLSLYLNTKVS